jgi:hypothetical protein
MTTPTTEPLQFDVAEDTSPAATGSSELRCTSCSTPLTSYFDANGKPVCEGCKDALVAFWNRSHVGTFLPAVALGLCGAAAGAGLFYGIAALTGYSLGLVAIVVGLLVGLGVRRGSGGRGGWPYQALAIGLTYVAVCSTYVPTILKLLEERGLTPDPVRVAWVALKVPFLRGTEGIMGWVIIGIALYEAWKVNKLAPLAIDGPLAVGAPRP